MSRSLLDNEWGDKNQQFIVPILPRLALEEPSEDRDLGKPGDSIDGRLLRLFKNPSNDRGLSALHENLGLRLTLGNARRP